MKDKSTEAAKVVKLYGNTESRPYEYEGLPAAENFMPLQKYPPQTVLTEKIGNTEYMVNAHFREDGRDLLYHLSRLLLDGVEPNSYRE